MSFVWCLFFVFVLGLMIGSFINCVVYRWRAGKSFWRGRSFCPYCKHQLSWKDNIPLISFLLLRGRCRYCQKRISWQYPIVELLSGFLFSLAFVAEFGLKRYYGFDVFNGVSLLILVRNWLFTAVLIIIFIYDLKYYLILDKLTLPAMLAALVFNLTVGMVSHQAAGIKYLGLAIWGPYLLAAAGLAGFFWLQFIISHGKWIGGGDIRLGALMGLMLGWPQALVALVLGYILGCVVGIGLIIFKKKSLNSQVPLGTFLSVSSWVALLWGGVIVDWYLSLSFI